MKFQEQKVASLLSAQWNNALFLTLGISFHFPLAMGLKPLALASPITIAAGVSRQAHNCDNFGVEIPSLW